MQQDSSQLATVAKRFRWDSAHRLPKHDGPCRNLHGHSYSMVVAFEGPIGDDGIAIDFKVIKNLVKSLVDDWDHATLIAEYDTELLSAVQSLQSRYVILPADSTAENLASLALDHILDQGSELLRKHDIRHLRVRIEETETCYAEVSRAIR